MRAPDGTRLAYAIHGSGPPLVVASCWLSHLQHDWQSPVWRHFLEDLGAMTTMLRYDERGFGMSDWNVDDFSLAARLADLETVVERPGSTGSSSWGCRAAPRRAMAYAIAHPERISRLILYGTVCGEPVVWTADEQAVEDTYRSMIRVGWAKADPEFRRVFTTRFIPGGDRGADALVRRPPADVDVAGERGREPDRPPAGRHRRRDPADHRADADPPGDRRPVDDVRQRRRGLGADPGLAAGRARQPEPHPPRRRAGLGDVRRRGRGVHRAGAPPLGGSELPLDALSPREREVLELCAEGRTNEEIAAALTLSPRTVERHLSNIYVKLGVGGAAARTAAVARYLRER